MAQTQEAGLGIRVGHVAFRVKDVEATTQWYGAVLGARESLRIAHEDGDLKVLYLEFAPGQFLELFPHGSHKPATVPGWIGYRHLCVIVDSLEIALARAEAHGIRPFLGPRAGHAGERVAF